MSHPVAPPAPPLLSLEDLTLIRRVRAWSLKDLSERTAIPVSTLHRIERKQRPITAPEALALVRALYGI